MITDVKIDTKRYYDQLVDKTGCAGYLFTPTPLVIAKDLLDRLNTAVPALLDLLDTPAYFGHCMKQGHWSLPVQPMKLTDFTGCADFLLTDSGAKLIEMNINLPGKVGLMQHLAETARDCLGDPEASWLNTDFNARLSAAIRAALPTVPTAIVVSHLPASKKHQPHYRWFSEQLNAEGFDTTVVQANDLTMTPGGCSANGREFGAVINLVIPFVWEGNPAEFGELTAFWQRHPDRCFPNPTGGLFGTKDLLAYLDGQRQDPGSPVWQDFVLRARMLSGFDTPEALLEQFDLSELVLKPLKDYDTRGVYVQPDLATLEQVFLQRKHDYMVQEFTGSLNRSFLLPSGKQALTHSVIFRVFFASKQPIGYQGYFIHGEFNGDYYTAAVATV